MPDSRIPGHRGHEEPARPPLDLVSAASEHLQGITFLRVGKQLRHNILTMSQKVPFVTLHVVHGDMMERSGCSIRNRHPNKIVIIGEKRSFANGDPALRSG